MTHPFPKLPGLVGLGRPFRTELDCVSLEIEGALPEDLEGVMYRVGPDPAWPSRVNEDAFWNGDGMATSFRFHNGEVDLKSRYVRTQKFELERKARKSLFGVYRNPFTDDPSVVGADRGTANTNIVWHGGRLLALKEDSVPYELDPDTLETIGRYTFDDKLRARNFTAHPKIDPRTGELWAFGYEVSAEASADAALLVIDRDGKLIREEWFETPFPALMHDFAVTRDHVVFICCPAIADLERMKRGGAHFAWDDRKPTMVGIMRRDADVTDMRWFRGPAMWMSHVFNAVTIGNKVLVDLPAGNKCYYPVFPDWQSDVPLDFADLEGPHFYRWTFDLDSNDDEFERTRLVPGDLTGEMPRIDDRYAMDPSYRYGFIYVDDKSKASEARKQYHLSSNSLARLDFTTGEADLWHLGDGIVPQEVQFVPRAGSSEEGDGWLLCTVTDVTSEKSRILVLDAQRIPDGPVATILLPTRARMTFHGNWVSASVPNGWDTRPLTEVKQ